MRIRTLASAGIAITLATGLAACGGGDDKDSAAQGDTPAASADPNAAGDSPGSGADAYKSDDKFVPGNNKITDVPAKTVIFADFKIFPAKIVAKPGEEWTEDNQDVATHNLTKDGDKQKNGDISPDVMSGQKAKFKMPTKKGKYKVVCYYHQNMTATVTVK